jgi:hypothetical protein
MNDLSNNSGNKIRNQIIMSIQRENNQIKQIEAENRELKNALVDYQFALDLIMFKYRKQINQLIKFNQITRQQCSKSGMACGGHPQQALQEFNLINSQNEKLKEVMGVMQKALHSDDEHHSKVVQKIKQLSEENKTLRQMLSISEKISGPMFGPNVRRKTAEVAVQTDDSSESTCSVSLESSPPTAVASSTRESEVEEISERLRSVQTASPSSARRELNLSPKDPEQCTPSKVSSAFSSPSSDHSPNDDNTRFADQVGTIKKNLPNGRIDHNESNCELDADHVTI